MSNILVLGGTGFIGRHICEQLQRAGHRMTVPTRQAKRADVVRHLPLLTVLTANVHDPEVLAQLMAGHDAVVNLVAILHGNEAAFERAHVTLARTIAQACQRSGVRRVVHVSALGAAADGPSMYLRSKAKGEAVLQAAGLDLTLLRPSVVFGEGDRFLNLFGGMQKLLPLVPLAGADTRFQPVWVEDVASAVVHALTDTATIGQTVEVVGPDVFTLRELVRMAGRTVGHQRPVLGLPRAVAYFQALLMELAPGEPLMSTDNLSSLEVANVASPASAGIPTTASWGLTPAHLAAILPTYMGTVAGGQGPRNRLLSLRAKGRA
ncbi:MAG: complex I NDUFA9 subunit family protein [Burkholderiaceae bacterium]|nr:complex I NDUFA9 subunit family protein [Burkholderiaceae bacterium]MDZ4161931.1 complex I NDUFA9 subunit family protein [Burkholderiales bacterium]